MHVLLNDLQYPFIFNQFRLMNGNIIINCILASFFFWKLPINVSMVYCVVQFSIETKCVSWSYLGVTKITKHYSWKMCCHKKWNYIHKYTYLPFYLGNWNTYSIKAMYDKSDEQQWCINGKHRLKTHLISAIYCKIIKPIYKNNINIHIFKATLR